MQRGPYSPGKLASDDDHQSGCPDSTSPFRCLLHDCLHGKSAYVPVDQLKSADSLQMGAMRFHNSEPPPEMSLGGRELAEMLRGSLNPAHSLGLQ